MILAGDIGGTNTRLALVEIGQSGRLRLRAEESFQSRDWPCLEATLAELLRRHPAEVTAATFGIAGPVRGGRCAATNLPWVVDARAVARQLGLERVGLVNDLVANAHGLPLLSSRDLVTLNRGARRARGNRALVSAGTGLGEAGLFWDGAGYRPFPSEGGHADFAPRNRLEIELLEHLAARFGRVSYERIVSGPGLVNVYEFLRDTGKGDEPPWLAAQLADGGDRAAVISRAALAGTSPLCGRALDLFVSVYGAEAGNMALKLMATGGVYLGGGIPPRILARLQEPTFMAAFAAKGRLSPMVRDTPVRVIMNQKTALLGAARHAALGLVD